MEVAIWKMLTAISMLVLAVVSVDVKGWRWQLLLSWQVIIAIIFMVCLFGESVVLLK